MKRRFYFFSMSLIITICFLVGCTQDTQTSSPLDTVAKDEEWMLLLVNRETPLPNNFCVELQLVDGYIRVDHRIAQATKDLLCAAKKEGISLIVASSYRSVEYQQEIYNKSIATYLKKGFSKEDATKLTLEYYATPRTSEHHTGLALDIVTKNYQILDEHYADTAAAKWLLKNAPAYGFVLRYPKEKEEITHINYEPWHFRYVGKSHAKYMTDNNLCLEEYLPPKDK